MLVLMVAVTTLGLTLESRGGPVERAVLGFPFGIFQPAQVWDSLPSVWVGQPLVLLALGYRWGNPGAAP